MIESLSNGIVMWLHSWYNTVGCLGTLWNYPNFEISWLFIAFHKFWGHLKKIERNFFWTSIRNFNLIVIFLNFSSKWPGLQNLPDTNFQQVFDRSQVYSRDKFALQIIFHVLIMENQKPQEDSKQMIDSAAHCQWIQSSQLLPKTFWTVLMKGKHFSEILWKCPAAL